ncbi:MAG: tetratricopeptide repeat protein [Thermodesulfobacteriota bacterium]
MVDTEMMISKDRLEELLTHLEEQEPPAELSRQVMQRLKRRKPSFFEKVSSFFTASHTITLQPLRLAAAGLVLCLTFFLGMQASSLLDPPSRSHDGDQPNLAAALSENGEASFLVGRGLLVADRPDQALALLTQAGQLNPDNPEYALWQGMAYLAQGDLEQERLSYQRALTGNQQALPLLLNLGHNYLQSGELEESLEFYRKVLALSPDHPGALYNTGLINQQLGDSGREISVWQQYLANYRTGRWAFRAVQHLNSAGDYSYRVYRVGARRIILNQKILLDPERPEEDKRRELMPVIAVLSANPDLQLDLVGFAAEGKRSAKTMVSQLRRIMIDELGSPKAKRIRLSWFGEAESLQINNNYHQLTKGLLLFSRVKAEKPKENRI